MIYHRLNRLKCESCKKRLLLGLPLLHRSHGGRLMVGAEKNPAPSILEETNWPYNTKTRNKKNKK